MSNAPRYSLNKNKYLAPPELDHLTYLLRNHLENDPKGCILLLLALHTGARAKELLNLTPSDIDDHHETVYIRGLKGSNDREIPLPDWLFSHLKKYIAVKDAQVGFKKTERIFPFTYNRLLQIWHLYRPVPKKFHALRHTFAIQLYKKTKDIRLLQVALGHRNITNTMIYADYVYSQQELRRLIL